ncbi:MAG: hypothetical protein ACRC20_09835 [Segniliparus sp.]|uniref:hypothetical protein n=1 Tax=Segniliparus sp. TaxID=2804064 RepID=UPI003F3EE75C
MPSRAEPLATALDAPPHDRLLRRSLAKALLAMSALAVPLALAEAGAAEADPQCVSGPLGQACVEGPTVAVNPPQVWTGPPPAGAQQFGAQQMNPPLPPAPPGGWSAPPPPLYWNGFWYHWQNNRWEPFGA